MSIKSTKLTGAAWAFLFNCALWAGVIGAGVAVCGCDTLPVEALELRPDVGPAPTSVCNQDLIDAVMFTNENLLCHAECVTLELECLELEAPECYACEHEAAICRSSCPEPVL